MNKDYGFTVIESVKQIVYCGVKFFDLKLINKFIFTILYVFVTAPIFGQQFSIAGKIFDETNQPIAYANVLLLKAQDSTIVTGTTSDDFGKFVINGIDQGSYIIKISFIGFKDYSLKVLVEDNKELKAIILIESTELLSEVEIIYKKPTLKKEVDRLVFNIESTALTEGNIMEVLVRTPGVLILDNSISIKNSTPTVYINDRKVHLSIEEIAELLEGTSASNIKAIEVITNPPARYDAESGAVLNIVMSKNLITGYSGSLFANYTQGVFSKQNYGMTHFFKNSKINFFANYSYNHNKINRVNKEFVDYSTQQWNSDINRNTWSETHNINMNFDYLIDESNILSFSTNMQFLPYFKYILKNNTIISNALQDGFDSNNLSRDKKHNLWFDLDFVHNFKKDNAKLSFNSHYTTYDYQRRQEVNSSIFFADMSLDFNTAFNTMANQDTEIITSQIDYSLPISESSSFEAGIKFSDVKTKSDIIKNNIINGQQEPDLNNTDAFNYDENIYAAYLSYENNWEKWSISAGLRLEQTNIEGESALNNQTNTQDYLEWFPTGNIGFHASEKVNVYANYKRSIQRPDYNDLNPFKFFLNDNTVVVGNPNLQPVFIDHFTIGTSISNKYTFEAYYKENAGNIFELPLQDNSNNSVAFTPMNIERSIEFGFDFLTFFNVNDKWSVSFVTSFYNIQDEAKFNGNSVKLDKWSNYSVFNNNFSFLKDESLTANFTLTYVSANIQGLTNVDTRVLTELSIKKTIFKGKGVLSLAASDLFNDHDFLATTKYLDQNSSVFSNLDNRYVKFGFRYKFGNTKLSTNERSKTQEELDRDRLKDNEH